VKTRKLLIILLVAVLLVVYYLLGTGYLKQRQENEALASQLANTAQALAQIPQPPADLESQLAAAQASLDAAQNLLPASMNSTQIVNTILRLADEDKVKAIPLVTQPWTTIELGDHSYSVFRLNVAVTGTFAQLVSFVSRLENGELRTLIIEDLSVTRATGEAGAKSAPVGTIPVNASLDLAIYTQSPTPERLS
jgi:Tfp pilus assembly protein PilO